MAAISTTSEFLSLECNKEHQEVAKEIITVLSFPENPVHLQATLTEVFKLLPTVERLDYQRKNAWQAWASTLPILLASLSKLEVRDDKKSTTKTKSNKKNKNPWYGKFEACPLPSLLSEEIRGESAGTANIIKALFIAAYRLYTINSHARQELQYLGKTCNDFRKSHIHYFPERTVESFIEWIDALKVRPPSIPRYGPIIPDKLSHLRTLKKAWILLSKPPSISEISTSSPLPIETEGEDLHEIRIRIIQPTWEEEPDVVFTENLRKPRRRQKRSPPFILELGDSFHPLLEQVVQEPEFRKIIPQFDCAQDEPTPSSSAQSLEVRYTNYRTAVDNQDLPFGWNKLNRIEVTTLVNTIFEHQTTPGAVFAWLILMTGQPLSNLAKWKIGSIAGGTDCIDPDFYWIHRLPRPPKSFSPTVRQQEFLYSNKEFVHLPLPKPLPSLIQESANQGMNHSVRGKRTLFQLLGVSEIEAEEQLRKFLADIRMDRKLRITPGRIRLTLQAALMAITTDRVITHLLSGLITDMPPSAIYYTTYDETTLIDAYVNATSRILGRNMTNA